MSEPTGLREKKKYRTRRTIERVALNLFETQGFDGTTIDEIAAAADIAPRTFFHYFPSKEDVILADYAERLERIAGTLQTIPANQAPWLALQDAFLGVATDYEREKNELLRRFRIMATAPSVTARSLLLQAKWELSITDAVAAWMGIEADDDLRPALIAGAALAAMRASLAHWLHDGGRTRLPDHISHCFDLMSQGLGTVGSQT